MMMKVVVAKVEIALPRVYRLVFRTQRETGGANATSAEVKCQPYTTLRSLVLARVATEVCVAKLPLSFCLSLSLSVSFFYLFSLTLYFYLTLSLSLSFSTSLSLSVFLSLPSSLSLSLSLSLCL